MKKINNFIIEKLKGSKTSFMLEKLKINSKSKIKNYNYFPKDRSELNLILMKKKMELDERDYKIDCSDIDVLGIEDLSELFKEENYTEINIEGWNLKKCKTLKSMFYDCIYLKKVIGFDSLDISNVKDLSFIFSRCTNLKDIGDLSKWDVKDKNLAYAFQSCKKLKSIGDLSKWDLKNPVWSTFEDCAINISSLHRKP